MGLVERYEEYRRRAENMRAVEPKLRRIYTEGKKDHLLMGRAVGGQPFAPLKPSTLKKRRGPGPPLSPMFSASRMVAKYTLGFEWLPSKLRIVADWPMPWVQFHKTGTRNKDGSVRMPKRDPSGFRSVDRQAAMKAMGDWIWRGEK